jgi:hypothetical protein
MADYIEAMAVRGVNKSRADLADFLSDISWETDPKKRPKARAGEGFRSALEDDDPIQSQDDAADHSERVFRLLDERSTILQGRYPFEIRGERLFERPSTPEFEPYLGLLALTLAHAYKWTDVPELAHRAFEDTVTRVMTVRAPETVNMGLARRSSTNFTDALDAIGPTIRLKPNAKLGSRATKAQDAKVDVISHLWWGDERAAGWVFLGQVTVAESEDWNFKLMEPPFGSWRRYLGLLPAPIVYLAVPHHVEPKHLYDLMEGYERMVLDRLRIAAYLPEASDLEREFIAKLRTADIAIF